MRRPYETQPHDMCVGSECPFMIYQKYRLLTTYIVILVNLQLIVTQVQSVVCNVRRRIKSVSLWQTDKQTYTVRPLFAHFTACCNSTSSHHAPPCLTPVIPSDQWFAAKTFSMLIGAQMLNPTLTALFRLCTRNLVSVKNAVYVECCTICSIF